MSAKHPTSPCSTCPYRKDAPLRHWAHEEFEGLLDAERSQFGKVYACHGHAKIEPRERGFCAGWLLDQRKRGIPSIALRVLLIQDATARAARSRGEAESALAEVVVAGAAPPPRRRRRQRCSACLEPGHIARKCPRAPAEEPPPPAPADEDLSLYEAALVPGHAPMFPVWQEDPPRVGDVDRPAPPAASCTETPAPVQVAAPAAGDWRKSTAFRERVAAGMRARWARRRAARAAASNEPAKQEQTPAGVVAEPSPATCPVRQTDPSCLTDQPPAADEANVDPDDAPPLRKAQRRCSRCGIPGHRASTCDVQPLTRDERRMAIEAWATRRRSAAPAPAPPPAEPPPPLVCRTFTADEDFSEFWPDLVLPPTPVEPEPEIEFNLGKKCGLCGRPGHMSSSCAGDDIDPAPEVEAEEPPPPPRPLAIEITDPKALRQNNHTISGDRPLTRIEQDAALEIEHPSDIDRPRTRGDCVGADRPCPWVSCKWHLSLDVNPDTGALTINPPGPETCVLDVADRGAQTLEAAGQLIGLTRERIRQIEIRGLKLLARHADDLEAAPVRGSSAPEDAIT